jgi:membrane-anchored protein YejM (alkaline phosphatase superfamily)
MIWQFFVAGLIAALGAFVHTVFGERTNIKNLWTSAVPINEKLELRGTWHGFGVLLVLTAVVLLLIALTDVIENPRMIAHFIAITYALIGLTFLSVVLREGVAQVDRVPGWLLLLAIAGFTWWGATILA